MSDLSEYELHAISVLTSDIETGNWSNDGLVRLIELAADYLNLKTIPKYAKENTMSYNGVKNYREIRIIIGVKFVIDNE